MMRILTSTGRGGYVDPTKVTLDELLARYDQCPSEFIDEPREAVIDAYHAAIQKIAPVDNSGDNGDNRS